MKRLGPVLIVVLSVSAAAQTINPSQVRGTATVQTPTTTQTTTQPSGTFDKHNALSADGNFVTANAGAQTLFAWGNSQTQGIDPSQGCNTLTCHPPTAWPAVFAKNMGWTLNNQAYGSSNCADLTYQGTSLSMWDQIVTTSSRNIYGHFRNDQGQYGPLPYRVDFARGCIAAQTAWLAIPETGKKRANGGYHDRTGTWVDGSINSTTSKTLTAGATMTFFVAGKTAYLATARIFSSSQAKYTVSVDGVPVYDPTTQSYTFTQDLDVNGGGAGFPVSESIIPYMIRIPGLTNVTHGVTYTCVTPGTQGCLIFFAAGVGSDNSTANGPFVYSLSPVNNSTVQQAGFFFGTVTSTYDYEWARMLAEFNGDGLQVIGLDTLNLNVYNPDTDTQPDGVHPSVAGAAKLAAGMAQKATSAATPLDRADSKLSNGGAAYGGIGSGPPPSPSGAGSTNPTYQIPPGSGWTSTGPMTGREYFGYDGTTCLGRLIDDPANTLSFGFDHIIVTCSVDGKDVNFATSGQITAIRTSVNSGGRMTARNGNGGVFGELIAEGSGGDGVPGWASNAILHTNRNLVLNSDLGAQVFQINRVGKLTLTGADLLSSVPITANGVQIGGATQAGPNTAQIQENAGTLFIDSRGPDASTPGSVQIRLMTSTGVPGPLSVPAVGLAATTGQAACIKASGPPVVLGTCSTVVSATGACTCN